MSEHVTRSVRRRVANSVLPEVALRESSAGPRFQIPLECDRPMFVCELDDDIQMPWSSADRMPTAAFVMCLQPRAHVGSQPGVVPLRLVIALENVDEAFGN